METEACSVTFAMERGSSKVLDDVSLSVRRDEILGIVGESGSGKSMFASALLDAVDEPGELSGSVQYYPSNGTPVTINDISKQELNSIRWAEISMVFQGAMSSFNPTLSIRGHFIETLDAHDAPRTAGMERAHELLEDLYLDPARVLSSYPHELSGGMRQRTLIALSLVLEPVVLVMDEPTASLDLLMQRSILQLLKDIKQKYDLTLIFITHDLPLVADLADRLAVMYAFRFVEIGPTVNVLTDATHPYTRALLNATPNLTMPTHEMEPIEGSSPDPVNVPSGCSYHPRCPLADEHCRSTDPHLEQQTPRHDVACFYPDRSKEAIPLKVSSSNGDSR